MRKDHILEGHEYLIGEFRAIVKRTRVAGYTDEHLNHWMSLEPHVFVTTDRYTEYDFAIPEQLDLEAIISGNVHSVTCTRAHFAVDWGSGTHLLAPRSPLSDDPLKWEKAWKAFDDAYKGIVVPIIWRIKRERLDPAMQSRIDYLANVSDEISKNLQPPEEELH